jgi:hypothetical protein
VSSIVSSHQQRRVSRTLTGLAFPFDGVRPWRISGWRTGAWAEAWPETGSVCCRISKNGGSTGRTTDYEVSGQDRICNRHWGIQRSISFGMGAFLHASSSLKATFFTDPIPRGNQRLIRLPLMSNLHEKMEYLG